MRPFRDPSGTSASCPRGADGFSKHRLLMNDRLAPGKFSSCQIVPRARFLSASVLGVFEYVQEMREILHDLQNRMQKAKQNIEGVSQAMKVSVLTSSEGSWGNWGPRAARPDIAVRSLVPGPYRGSPYARPALGTRGGKMRSGSEVPGLSTRSSLAPALSLPQGLSPRP